MQDQKLAELREGSLAANEDSSVAVRRDDPEELQLARREATLSKGKVRALERRLEEVLGEEKVVGRERSLQAAVRDWFRFLPVRS